MVSSSDKHQASSRNHDHDHDDNVDHDGDAASFVSDQSDGDVTSLMSRLNDVEAAILTESSKRKRNSTADKQVLRQLALLKLDLLSGGDEPNVEDVDVDVDVEDVVHDTHHADPNFDIDNGADDRSVHSVWSSSHTRNSRHSGYPDERLYHGRRASTHSVASYHSRPTTPRTPRTPVTPRAHPGSYRQSPRHSSHSSYGSYSSLRPKRSMSGPGTVAVPRADGLSLPHQLPLTNGNGHNTNPNPNPNPAEIEIAFDYANQDSASQVSGLYSSPSLLAEKQLLASRRERQSKAIEDKRFENAGYQPDLVMTEKKGPAATSSIIWEFFANLITFPIHDAFICTKGTAAKKAWREKVAITSLFLLVSGIFVAAVTIIPVFICVESDEYYDVDQVATKGWTNIYGNIYDLRGFLDLHPGGRGTLEDFFGVDASSMFPRLPPTELPSYCLSDRLNETVFNATNSLGLQNITCDTPSAEDLLIYGEQDICHSSVVGIEEINSKLGDFQKGQLVVPGWTLSNRDMQFIVIDDTVYNVTSYLRGMETDGDFTINTDHATNEYAYLNAPLHTMVVNKLNEDASVVFHNVFRSAEDKQAVKGCLDELFFHAKIDNRYSETCQRIAVVQYSLAGLLGFLALVQVGCSMVYIARRPPMVRDEDKKAAVMVMVPCYNESEGELRKTIDSVLVNDYPDENTVLVVVADGVITGRGESMSCPETLGSILGFEFNAHDDALEYQSVGAKTTNAATIYAGTYHSRKHHGKSLKYMVLVKQGMANERGTPRAGNRGKRDSQLLLFGILNRLQYDRRPSELDLSFMASLDALDLALKDMEYLMAIDADTRVSEDAIKYFVHKMDHDKSVLACCGETQVDNKSQSFVTMIQVFEYYSAHHLKKAFESVFGCVTCLPGCFTMYRLYTDEFQPLLCCDNVFTQYSRNDITSLHERNLYELGEDRMLTTLMLQEFHQMKLSFVPEAVCWTIVPHTFQILKSQRRRWINSTIHNMCELLKVETMCGVCIFSMKMVVIFDLVSTFLLPSGCVYLYYIVADIIISTDPLSPLQIVAFAYVALMTLPFIFRAQWSYFFHFFMFLIGGIPMFYFYLPIYAFWHMDDLSWGKTRQVQATPDASSSAEGANSKNKIGIDSQADTETPKNSISGSEYSTSMEEGVQQSQGMARRKFSF